MILRHASQLGIVAIGQTLVVLVSGLDLSVTGVIVLTSVVIAEATEERLLNLLQRGNCRFAESTHVV